MSKRCTKCGEVKTLSAFNKQKMGHYPSCKECRHKYYMDNKQRLLIHRAKYREKNKEKCYLTTKNWRENNKEKVKTNWREYYENNSEKIKEYSKQYQKNNSEKIKEYSKQYQKKNRKILNKNALIKRTNGVNNLSKWYVTTLLTKTTNLSADDIKKYPMLIEAKRDEIKLIRLIKQLSK